jgi:hypothetical protein
MIVRAKTFLFILITLFLSGMVYFFENKVHDISEQIQDTQEKLAHYDEDLKVLEADWSYLNDPERLTNLAEKVDKDMSSPVKIQFTRLNDLPNREVMQANASDQNRIIP